MLIKYTEPCTIARLIRREKRFLVEFYYENPEQTFWAHTNNTGSMMGLIGKGRPILLSKAQNPKRKLAWTLEAIGLPSINAVGLPSVDAIGLLSVKTTELYATDTVELVWLNPEENPLWVGVNTMLPNKILHAAFHSMEREKYIPWACGYSNLKLEATHGQSRLDGLCTGENLAPLWIECKNVSLVEYEQAMFPDAVSERAAKHLDSLQELVQQGSRAAMLYVVQRNDAKCFSPADCIDAVYAKKFYEAQKNGVEMYAISLNLSAEGISLSEHLPISPNQIV